MTDLAIHGGVRPGAGRPRTRENELKDARAMSRYVSTMIKQGLSKILGRYDEMLDTALGEALKRDEDGKYVGDKKLLTFLIDLPTKIVRVTDDSPDSPFAELIREVRKDMEVTISVSAKRAPVASDSGENTREAEYRVVE